MPTRSAHDVIGHICRSAYRAYISFILTFRKNDSISASIQMKNTVIFLITVDRLKTADPRFKRFSAYLPSVGQLNSQINGIFSVCPLNRRPSRGFVIYRGNQTDIRNHSEIRPIKQFERNARQRKMYEHNEKIPRNSKNIIGVIEYPFAPYYQNASEQN